MTITTTRKPFWAKPVPAEPARKTPGKLGRAIRRRRSALATAARPYLASGASIAVLAFVLAVTAPALEWLVLLPLGGVLAIAGDRLREHLGWHRRGGKAAARKRRRYQGNATLAEISRNLSHDRGVLIGTVRRTK